MDTCLFPTPTPTDTVGFLDGRGYICCLQAQQADFGFYFPPYQTSLQPPAWSGLAFQNLGPWLLSCPLLWIFLLPPWLL